MCFFWKTISDVFGISIGSDFLSIARWWISNDKNAVLNTFSFVSMDFTEWILFSGENMVWAGRCLVKGNHKRQKVAASLQGCSYISPGPKPAATGKNKRRASTDRLVMSSWTWIHEVLEKICLACLLSLGPFCFHVERVVAFALWCIPGTVTWHTLGCFNGTRGLNPFYQQKKR
jgi:hypothetical protein